MIKLSTTKTTIKYMHQTTDHNMASHDICAHKDATTHQRGHTCWFDTAIVTMANTNSMRMIHDEGERHHNFSIRRTKKRISDEILEHGGLSEYSDKLQKTISIALGEAVCPMKSSEGKDILSFLEIMFNHVKIDTMVLKVPSISNTPMVKNGNPEHTCERIGTIDIDTYLEENLSRGLNRRKGSDDNGVILVQCRGAENGCYDLECRQSTTIKTPYGTYELSLTSMAVSAQGHVMSFGKCRDPTEWVVFDNEFTGSGYKPRTFYADTFELVKEQMYRFPHTYFDPKHGAVPMNPFFKKGIRSSTLFVYDFVKWDE